jgi:hypothetical protein
VKAQESRDQFYLIFKPVKTKETIFLFFLILNRGIVSRYGFSAQTKQNCGRKMRLIGREFLNARQLGQRYIVRPGSAKIQ